MNAKGITEKVMKMVIIDSTVKEKNLMFPADAKLYRKIIAKVQKIAREEEIELRWTYTRELKALKLKVRFMNHQTRFGRLENVLFENEQQIANLCLTLAKVA